MKQNALDIIYYLILAALVVLIIMNASKFATAVTAVTGGTNTIFGDISGASYGKG